MTELTLDHLSPAQIKPRKRRYRQHSVKQIDLIARSLKDRGCIEPLLVDSEDRIVCGEAVVTAAKQIGLHRIPVVRANHLTDDELRAYAIAANKLAELSGYDEELLGLELSEINDLLDDPDLTDLGFEPAEIDRLLGFTDLEAELGTDNMPDVHPERPIAKLGDLWLLGNHKLYCGDALSSVSYETLMGEERAEMVLSDVPYNLSADSISGNGQFKHEDFVQASGELDRAQFTRFLTTSMRHMREFSKDGSLHMIFMSWHYLLELLRAGHIVYDELKNIVTWVKKSGGMGSLYRSQTEFIAIFKNGTEPHINNILLGKFGRNRTNAWFFDGMNTATKGRDELLALHPTVKPLDLLADAILDVSTKDGIVLDPFVGSGSTIIAAEKVQRRARAIELDSLYVDVALRRFAAATGIDPIRAADGQPLSELEEEHSDTNPIHAEQSGESS